MKVSAGERRPRSSSRVTTSPGGLQKYREQTKGLFLQAYSGALSSQLAGAEVRFDISETY